VVIHRRTALNFIVLLIVAAALAWSLPSDAVARGLFQSPQPTPFPTDTPWPTFTPAPTESPTPTLVSPTETPAPTPTELLPSATPVIAVTDTPLAPSATPAVFITETPLAPLDTPTGPLATDIPVIDIIPNTTVITVPLVAATPEGTQTLPVEPETQEEAPAIPSANPQSEPAPGFLPAPTLTAPDTESGEAPELLSGLQPPLIAPAVPSADPAENDNQTPDQAATSVAELIDNGVIALSYVWLCCGGLFLIAAALLLIWLSRRGRRRAELASDGEKDDNQTAEA
jgi:hypothetical protein